jgi:hypothetical protein
MEQAGEKRWLIVIYAATIFVSALLLFQVQPIISRYILPWFGGTPAVWTTAMLFFQMLLFAGYAYAHLSVHYLRPRWQVGLHLALLAAAAASLPFVPDSSWKPVDSSNPVLRILLLLAVSVGLPYFVLATTGPLVQAWFSRTIPGRSPYRLFSLSNLGSLLALLSYPFLIEPRLPLGSQALAWQWAFWLFAALCAFGAIRTIGRGKLGSAAVRTEITQRATPPRFPAAVTPTNAASEKAPGLGRRLLWLVLSAFASMAFLATTNFVCQDVTPIPFLWIVPLSLYLLSFIICFDHERWYQPRITAAGLLLIYILAAVYLYRIQGKNVSDLALDMGLSFVGLFCLCMLCHGELVRFRPDPAFLTSFYLLISAGGALGGLFVGIVAPLVFNGYGEWYIALGGSLVLAVAVLIGTGKRGLFRRHLKEFAPATAILAVALVTAGHLALAGGQSVQTVEMRRNFYGVLIVQKYIGRDGDVAHVLVNGRTIHGLQFTDFDRRQLPTTYYTRTSGVGKVIEFLDSQSTSGLRVGAIGLGTGTLAAYARPNDRFVFYEIDPDVTRVSDQYFTFLKDARARLGRGSGSLEIVMGDARLSLERELNSVEGRRDFDLLVVDAFSGDAIPTHLLTRQAADIYRHRLADNGVLAIHISNLHLDLAPVARGLAEYLGLKAIEIDSPKDARLGQFDAKWMLLTKNDNLAHALEPLSVREEPINSNSAADSPARRKPGLNQDRVSLPPLLWTDDFSNLFRILQ